MMLWRIVFITYSLVLIRLYSMTYSVWDAGVLAGWPFLREDSFAVFLFIIVDIASAGVRALQREGCNYRGWIEWCSFLQCYISGLANSPGGQMVSGVSYHIYGLDLE